MFLYAKSEQKQAPKNTVQKKDLKKEPLTPNQTGIPNSMKTQFENLSGFSFDDVRVHYNSDKPAQLQALAYTQGNQVHIGPGQEKHLEHELGHVVQQKRGIVNPTITINGIRINDDPNLEKEANINVLRSNTNEYGLNTINNGSNETIQKMPFDQMITDIHDEFESRSVNFNQLAKTLQNLLVIQVINSIDIEPSEFMMKINFEKNIEDGGGAQFIPIKDESDCYTITYHIGTLWNKCKRQIGVKETTPDSALNDIQKVKIATMILANIEHELTHAAVAFKMHEGKGITKEEYAKIKEINARGVKAGSDEQNLVDKYRSFSSNVILKSYLGKVFTLCDKLLDLCKKDKITVDSDDKFIAITYLEERAAYIKANAEMEIDSVVTDLCVLFNMIYPESHSTKILNKFAGLCLSIRKGIEIEVGTELDILIEETNRNILEVAKK